MSRLKLTILIIFGLIGFYLYWYISTLEQRCANYEYDEMLPIECMASALESAKKGGKGAIFIYTRQMEMTVLDEAYRDNPSIESLADAIINRKAPSKAEYLFWLRIAAKNGEALCIRTVLDFCQAGVPSFDSVFIQQIFDSPQRKTWYSDPDPMMKETNRSELAWIDDLERSWRNGKFSPCIVPDHKESIGSPISSRRAMEWTPPT